MNTKIVVENIHSLKRMVIVNIMTDLLTANNTVTTLEIKTEARTLYPDFYWDQATVSKVLDELASKGALTYTDNGTFRTYSEVVTKRFVNTTPTTPKKAVKTTTKRSNNKILTAKVNGTITRTKALKLIENNKGHFFSVVFDKKSGEERVMNAQYLSDQSDSSLGYVKVKETGKMRTDPKKAIRNINLQTLKKISIAGKTYNVK